MRSRSCWSRASRSTGAFSSMFQLLASGLASISAASTLPPETSIAEQLTPLELFQAACVDGKAALKADTVQSIQFAAVPRNARMALNSTYLTGSPRSQKARNDVYRVTGPVEMFLLLPVSPRTKPSRLTAEYDRSCAVMWRGNEFMGAKRYIDPSSDNRDPSKGFLGFANAGVISGDLYLTTAFSVGWTAVRSEQIHQNFQGAK